MRWFRINIGSLSSIFSEMWRGCHIWTWPSMGGRTPNERTHSEKSVPAWMKLSSFEKKFVCLCSSVVSSLCQYSYKRRICLDCELLFEIIRKRSEAVKLLKATSWGKVHFMEKRYGWWEEEILIQPQVQFIQYE